MMQLLKAFRLTLVVELLVLTSFAFPQSVAALNHPCNDDNGCSSLEKCLDGVCKTTLGQPCNDDAGCLRGGRNLQCRTGVCTPVVAQCTQDAQCPAGRLCITGQCLEGFCRNNTHCGDRQVCGSENRCRTVQCTAARHCAADQTCSPSTNMCVARCPSGQRFVRSNTRPVCSACVRIIGIQPPPIPPGGCPKGTVLAEGFCIADCRPKLAPGVGPKDPAGIGIIPPNLPAPKPMPQPAPGGGSGY